MAMIQTYHCIYFCSIYAMRYVSITNGDIMETQDAAVLVSAVAAGSLAAAARRLGITPMVATRRLAALERELGVRLMQRTTRALSLTPEGETFLPFAQLSSGRTGFIAQSLYNGDVLVAGGVRAVTSAPGAEIIDHVTGVVTPTLNAPQRNLSAEQNLNHCIK